MLEVLVSLVTGNVGVSLRRFARLAAFAILTAVFLAVALLAGLASIPLWMRAQPAPKPAAASLVELALAVGLGVLADRKRKPDGARGRLTLSRAPCHYP